MNYLVFAPESGLVSQRDDVYFAAYEMWERIWAEVFLEVRHSGDLSADEFIRHDRCCVLRSGLEIAGVHLYSFFDLKRPLQLRRKYLADNFDSLALEKIARAGCRRVMTMEYLSVAPAFRGAHIAETMICLGLKVFESETGLDGVIACTRNSRRVNEMGRTIGFQTIASGRVAHGEEADLMMFTRENQVTKNLFLQNEIDRLWKERHDLRPEQKRSLRAA